MRETSSEPPGVSRVSWTVRLWIAKNTALNVCIEQNASNLGTHGFLCRDCKFTDAQDEEQTVFLNAKG